MIGMDVEVSGITVRIGGTWAGIVPECTTLVPTILYTAAIIAFPSGWLWKGAGLLCGAALLWLYNIARIAALAFLHASDARLASLAHLYLWQTLTLIVVVSLFVAWVRLQPGSAARR
jgi:exosortase/archaeosortase family protein